ncbi:MAG: AAA family ATPase [Planctomycetota bacterium]|nr:AAA family ATPase [Planctomycetota bacterium]
MSSLTVQSRNTLRQLMSEIEDRERSKRQRGWDVRKAAALRYFGERRINAGRWANGFQASFGKLADLGKDFTAIPGYDTLADGLAADFPEYGGDDGCERLWTFLLSPHDRLPSRDVMFAEAVAQLAVANGVSIPESEQGDVSFPPVAEPKKPLNLDVILPAAFKRVFDLASAGRNILLVGPAGCGKTHLAKLVADQLGRGFGAVSCTAGMSEAHLLGRAMPNLSTGKTEFQSTDFIRCYEEGGVFLLDELDAADPNMLLAINTAISNGYCNLPNRPGHPHADRHADFVLIATANTFGRGANRSYAGRNQLDEATLDRFRIGIVEMTYDERIEKVLCPCDKLRGCLQILRQRIAEAGLRRILSTRFIQDAAVMARECNWTPRVVLDVFFEGWSTEEIAKVSGKDLV